MGGKWGEEGGVGEFGGGVGGLAVGGGEGGRGGDDGEGSGRLGLAGDIPPNIYAFANNNNII